VLPDQNQIELSVSEFVALFNQTLEFAYPEITIIGELANFRISKNKWVYFDLKDDNSSVKFFGSVYKLPGPLEDGLVVKVRGQPRLHNLYGFSVNVLSIQPAGEGSIKRAADLLKLKLQAEGLFDEDRKRPIPYPPKTIGLITSKQSAAYADFIKVLGARWRGINISLIDVQVQGEVAPEQIVSAINQLNSLAEPPEVLVLIRGGGSAEDLAAFNTEIVVRAVATSRVPTLVAIGHEIDLALSELAADSRASTPSNAAELIAPDRGRALSDLQVLQVRLTSDSSRHINTAKINLTNVLDMLDDFVGRILTAASNTNLNEERLINAYSPKAVLARGYAVVRSDGKAVRGVSQITAGDIVNIQLFDGRFDSKVSKIFKEKT